MYWNESVTNNSHSYHDQFQSESEFALPNADREQIMDLIETNQIDASIAALHRIKDQKVRQILLDRCI